MRDGERGDDAGHVPECAAEALRRQPRPVAAQQHCRQQKREQEQDVIEAQPDVPHAFVHVCSELLPAGAGAQLVGARPRAEDHAVAAIVLDVLQKPPMRRIDVEEQTIVDGKDGIRRGARSAESQHRIRSIAVLVDQHVAGIELAPRAA